MRAVLGARSSVKHGQIMKGIVASIFGTMGS